MTKISGEFVQHFVESMSWRIEAVLMVKGGYKVACECKYSPSCCLLNLSDPSIQTIYKLTT